MDDSQKFDFAKQQLSLTPVTDSEAPTHVTIPAQFSGIDLHVGDYQETQALGNAMVQARAEQIAKDRGIYSGLNINEQNLRLQSLIERVWSEWKSSSTSKYGLALQLAASQELGGQWRGSYAGQDPKRILENFSSKEFDALKAYVRAQWEVSNYILDKSNQQVLNLYRAVGIPIESNLSSSAGTTTEIKPVASESGNSAFNQLPYLNVQRNGAASMTADMSVANNWGSSSGDRVVLRAQVPRTAVLSLPVFGQNVTEEQEVVVTGTAWKKWDAWLRKAPSFAAVPIHKHLLLYPSWAA